MKHFTITENDADQRLDKFLQKAAPNLPKALLYKALRTKHIKVNRKRAEGSYRLMAGDSIDCYLADELFETPVWQYDFLYADKALAVLYEDEQMLLLDKPAGLLSHPNAGEYVDTLLGRVQRHLYEKGDYNPDQENAFAPALVNRIDRNTQGVVIAAKSAAALRDLNEKMKQRQLRKFYLCAVHGVPTAGSPTGAGAWRQLRSFMRKDKENAIVKVYAGPGPGRKECLTNYRLLHNTEDYGLLEVELLTGRTHQIRAQFAHLGNPLVGDGKYAPRAQYKSAPVKWQCLCSWRLVYDQLDISVNCVAFLRQVFPDFTLKREDFYK